MKKTVILAIVAVLVLTPVTPAFARTDDPPTRLDHWETREQCQAAKGAPWYEPSYISNKALGKDEEILPHPTGACLDIDLPDRKTQAYKSKGHGWVRIPAQRNVVYGKVTGADGKVRLVPKRLAQCDNQIFAEAALEEGGVLGNPLEHQEQTKVTEPAPTPSTPATLGTQANEMAKRQAALLEKEKPNNATGSSHKMGSAAKTAAKVGIGVAVVAAGVWAAKKIIDSLGSTVNIENNNNICVTTAGTQCKP